MANYAFKPAKTEETAYARIDGVNASFKDLANVCSNVRGRRADKAEEFLTAAAAGEKAVRYFNYNKRRGHVGELGGKKGGWPIKSARIVLDVLKNAIANAKAKGLGQCKIVHIQANKQVVFGRMSPKGRRIRHDLEQAFVEIALQELNIPENKERKVRAAKDAAKPKAEAKKESKPEEKKDTQKAEEKPAKTDVQKSDSQKSLTVAKKDEMIQKIANATVAKD